MKNLTFPAVMGILNVTPDSFHDGGHHTTRSAQLKKAAELHSAGASVIDIGAVSARPGAAMPSLQEELDRLLPCVEAVHQEFPDTLISVDTFRADAAVEAARLGAGMINDISGGAFDPGMKQTVRMLGLPYVMMHIRGIPETMQNNPVYTDVAEDVLAFFSERLAEWRAYGIRDIIIDPGFGFGKTIEHNYRLLASLHRFRTLGAPILAGISRKSMICKVLNIEPSAALNGTTALHAIALLQGADILRVHDAREAAEVIRLVAQYKLAAAGG